jgi:hypothetical protein
VVNKGFGYVAMASVLIKNYTNYLNGHIDKFLLEKPSFSHPVKEFPAFYGIGCFIAIFAAARYLYIS